MKKILISLSILIALIGSFWIYSSLTFPTTSPLNVISYFIDSKLHPHAKMTQQTIAFMPYWRLSDTKYTRFNLLSEINYFSLYVDHDGNFVKVIDNKTNPGWLGWNDQIVKDIIAKAQINASAFTVTVAMQKNDTIRQFLDNQRGQQTLITNIVDQIKARNLNGVIVDFEYDGTPEDKYKYAFTNFSQHLSQAMHQQIPDATISVTMLPLAGRTKGLFDFPKLIPFYNRFIGMSYDYYAQNSVIAGPVAPMTGFKENKYFFDVTTTYQDFSKIIPKNKLVMGIPYYGWDWTVEHGKVIQSKTLPANDPNNFAAVISYARAQEDKDLKPSQCQWDDYAKATWCWYKDDKKIEHQVWLEDTNSISTKFTFAKENNFAGIAIWTLGYDKGYPDLWNLMIKFFTTK